VCLCQHSETPGVLLPINNSEDIDFHHRQIHQLLI
jgi:hypothetical protein